LIFFILFIYYTVRHISHIKEIRPVIYIYALMNKNDDTIATNTNGVECVELSNLSSQPQPELKEKIFSYSVIWKYGDKPRDDCIEVTKMDKKVVKIGRWTTFKSFHFPEGAIVTGFRGRRDYKDGKCEGIMCCKWCSEKKAFISFIFTISNGYNGTFSEKDFETIEPVNQTEFISCNPHAVKNIKNQLR